MISVQVDIEKKSIEFSSSYKDESIVANYVLGLGFVREDEIVKFSDLSIRLTYSVDGEKILTTEYPDAGTVVEQTDQEILFYESLPMFPGSSCVLSVHITNAGVPIEDSFTWHTAGVVIGPDDIADVIVDLEAIANAGE
jgi:hypothetical protein